METKTLRIRNTTHEFQTLGTAMPGVIDTLAARNPGGTESRAAAPPIPFGRRESALPFREAQNFYGTVADTAPTATTEISTIAPMRNSSFNRRISSHE
jgi:hypothetical protein